MQNPNTADNNTTDPSTGFPEQPDQGLRPISAYRELVDNLSRMLIKEDWRKLKGNSTVISTVDRQLRDTIENLEILQRNGEVDSEDIDAVLEVLNNSLIELYKASILADRDDLSYLDHVKECRENLNQAVDLM